ncbi:MAG: hypothetical protein B7X08_00995 [Acidocella sp. 20-63-7]|nr:MAG: hypothetical protein B7X08_00995 [Acidocella sp. 20-63-7]HQT45803.1 ribbon-helix-helix domain-containing protein [Acidocella sp.]
MCKLFVGANPSLWEPQTHSLRLHGTSTSIRIETFFWRVLEDIARRDTLTLNELLTRLYDEVQETERDVTNFASFLRVCAARYLSLQLAGEIPNTPKIPIRTLDAPAILARERLNAAPALAPHN